MNYYLIGMMGSGKTTIGNLLSKKGDLYEAAQNLFDYLRKLDKLEMKRIAVTPIPQKGIGNTINESLPDGFQKSEYLLDHGMVDMVVHRKDLKSTISKIIDILLNEKD